PRRSSPDRAQHAAGGPARSVVASVLMYGQASVPTRGQRDASAHEPPVGLRGEHRTPSQPKLFGDRHFFHAARRHRRVTASLFRMKPTGTGFATSRAGHQLWSQTKWMDE